ncbi:MAG: zinc-ribbon domain-containing protein, partial [Desulfobacteraceae bacterium]
MIITCDKCSTKFNLDETLIKQTGSKVRCSVCSKVFTAFPPESSIQDEKDKEEEKTEPLEEPPAPSEEDPETTPADESFFGLEGIDDIGNELGIEDEEDESKKGADQETGKESPEDPFPAHELELDQELEEEIRFLEKEDEASGSEPSAPAEEPGTPSETEFEPLEDELELPESTEQEQPGPDISTEDAFSLEEEEEGEPLDLDLEEEEEGDSLDLDLEGMDLEDEGGSLDFDLNDIDTDEPDKDPGFDLDLDDETLELSMDDLEEMPEEEFDALENEEAEFDFTADDDDSFELEIDSDLEDEDDRESLRPGKTDLEKSSLKAVTGQEPAEPSTQPPPELEIGDLDIAEPDEMDIELDDASGLRQEDESELEDRDDQYADIELEEDEEPAGGSDEEEVEEFDLTLYDESLEDDFEDDEAEEAEDDYQPETEDEAEGAFEIGEQEASVDPKIEKPQMHDLMEPDKPSKPSGGSKLLKFILSILVIAIILVTSYSACIIMGIQVPYLSSLEIPFIESTLKKYQKKPAPA